MKKFFICCRFCQKWNAKDKIPSEETAGWYRGKPQEKASKPPLQKRPEVCSLLRLSLNVLFWWMNKRIIFKQGVKIVFAVSRMVTRLWLDNISGCTLTALQPIASSWSLLTARQLHRLPRVCACMLEIQPASERSNCDWLQPLFSRTWLWHK